MNEITVYEIEKEKIKSNRKRGKREKIKNKEKKR